MIKSISFVECTVNYAGILENEIKCRLLELLGTR